MKPGIYYALEYPDGQRIPVPSRAFAESFIAMTEAAGFEAPALVWSFTSGWLPVEVAA